MLDTHTCPGGQRASVAATPVGTWVGPGAAEADGAGAPVGGEVTAVGPGGEGRDGGGAGAGEQAARAAPSESSAEIARRPGRRRTIRPTRRWR
jgi:hypothetical protein